MAGKISIALVLALAIILSACSFSISTASLSHTRTGDTVKNNEVVKEVRVFNPDTPEIIVSTHLNKAPEGTKLMFSWRYLEGRVQDIDSVTVKTKSSENIAKSSLSRPNQGWPTGNYEVVLKLGDNSKPVHKKFSVR